MKHAPIALFAFNRPLHIQKTLSALIANPGFLESTVYVFSDGARDSGDEPQVDAVRQLVRSLKLSNIKLIERHSNYGLAKSVISGVSMLCEEFGRVIALEDDLVVAPNFLEFMNDALARYELDERVMQISGFMFDVKTDLSNTSFFLPIAPTWGWATWKRAWEKFDPAMTAYEQIEASRKVRRAFDLDNSYPYFRMLERQRRGETDSWGIRWYLSVFFQRGIILYPAQSLVQNIGFDGSGTHCGFESALGNAVVERRQGVITFPEKLEVDERVLNLVKRYLKRNNSKLARARIKLKAVLMQKLKLKRS